MKKCIRSVALLIVVVISVLPLAACRQLDEAKNNHAVYTDDSHQIVEFRGETYRFMNLSSNYQMIIPDEVYGNITEKDVPVLIAAYEGGTVCYDRQEEHPPVLSVELDYSSLRYYVRDDLYPEYYQASMDVQLDRYYTIGSKSDDPTSEDFSGWENYDPTQPPVKECILLDEELSSIITDTLDNDDTIVDRSYDCAVDFSLYRCDKNAVFSSGFSVVQLGKSLGNNDYFLLDESGDVHRIPKEKEPVLDSFFEKYSDYAEHWEYY